ncbi:hypothetical protein L195_g064024, partial [Trifolium pratense]
GDEYRIFEATEAAFENEFVKGAAGIGCGPENISLWKLN